MIIIILASKKPLTEEQIGAILYDSLSVKKKSSNPHYKPLIHSSIHLVCIFIFRVWTIFTGKDS